MIMAKKSAGLIMYRFYNKKLEVFLVHPGGPYWRQKDEGVWSIPKGEYTDHEDPFTVAKREFEEETGCRAEGDFIALSPIRQLGGKVVTAWAIEGVCDADTIRSNNFTMEWPPGSGRKTEFPEVDKAGWFPVGVAMRKLLKGQTGLIEQLSNALGYDVV
jgi:predicted NUDIX family NTP pyrophosphohydrolase